MPTNKDLDAAKAAYERAEARLKAMSEAEIEGASDDDNPDVSDEDLAGAWRVSPVEKTAAE